MEKLNLRRKVPYYGTKKELTKIAKSISEETGYPIYRIVDYIKQREQKPKPVEPDAWCSHDRKIYFMLAKKVKETLEVMNEYVEYDYSLPLYDIIDFLKAGARLGKWNLVEDNVFDKKNRGHFTVINVLGVGNGYAVIENFRYSQWKTPEYSTKRLNKFLFGTTEEGRFFLRPIPKGTREITLKQLVKASSKEEARRIAWKILTGVEPKADDIVQGDVLLKRIKKSIGNVSTSIGKFEVDHHIIAGNIAVGGDGTIYVKEASLIHAGGEHRTKHVPEGAYRVYVQREAPVWDFTRPWQTRAHRGKVD